MPYTDLANCRLDLRKIAPYPEPSTSDSEDSLSGGRVAIATLTRENWLMDAGDGSGMAGVWVSLVYWD